MVVEQKLLFFHIAFCCHPVTEGDLRHIQDLRDSLERRIKKEAEDAFPIKCEMLNKTSRTRHASKHSACSRAAVGDVDLPVTG